MSGPQNALRQQFRQKAQELAQVEGMILDGADHSTQNPSNFSKKSVQPTRVFIWLAVAAVGGALFAVTGKEGMFSLACGAAALVALVKAYLEWSSFRAERTEERADNKLTQRVTQLEARRKQLLSELESLRRQDASLSGPYWWDLGKNPAFDGKLLSGKVPGADQWEYALLSPVYLELGEDGVYLQDMQTFTVLVDGQEVRALLGQPNAPQAVLYQDDVLLTGREQAYKVMKLYAYVKEPIQEIQSSTKRTRIDKQAQMDAYRQKLDMLEIGMNALGSKALMTDQEMYLYGHKGLQEYAQDGLRRGLLEAQRMDKINAQGDYEETTTYRKVFRNLCRFTFVCCADLYISISDGTNGRVAAIAVPRAEQSALNLIVRTTKDTEFGGRLEPYGSSDAVEDGGIVGKMSIQMAADQLLHGETREQLLRLRKRDVLAPRPAGLDDYEWAYLIWRDQ